MVKNMKSKIKFKQIEMDEIPKDWEKICFSEAVEINPKRELKKGNIAKFVSMADIQPFTRKISNYTLREFKGGSKFKNNDTLFARITPSLENGKTAFVDILVDNEIGFGSTEFIILTAKEGKTDSYFVYYLSKNPEIRNIAIKSMTGTSGRQRVENDVFNNIIIYLPKIREQKAIAKILFSLDSKIEINQQMNKTIEAIGQTIFKQWFVDFEFPNEHGKPYKYSGGEMSYDKELGKEIPKGWTSIPLDQAAKFTRGFSYKGSEKSKINGEYVFITLNSVKEFGGFKREFSYITSDRIKEKHFVNCGDIVVANTEQTKTGTLLGCPALVEFPSEYEKDKGIFSHHITKVIPVLVNFKHYLYYHLFVNQQNAVKYNTGSVIWALDVNNWSKNEKIMLPEKKILQKFELLMETIFLKSLENNLQIESLTHLRDSLLPKFMSGKIRVPVGVR